MSFHHFRLLGDVFEVDSMVIVHRVSDTDFE
jgi:hypothetical protein